MIVLFSGRWAGEEGEDVGGGEEDAGPLVPQTTGIVGMGGADSDGDDSEDGDDMGDEDEEEEESEESDGESEMVVLDPDHPLMQRFQIALKSHLDKQNEKVTLELMELVSTSSRIEK